MADPDSLDVTQIDKAPIWHVLGIYLSALLLFGSVVAILSFVNASPLTHLITYVVTYTAIGIGLNPLILRKVVINPLANTIGNVVSMTLWAFALWPIAYAYLSLQLFFSPLFLGPICRAADQGQHCVAAGRPTLRRNGIASETAIRYERHLAAGRNAKCQFSSVSKLRDDIIDCSPVY